MHTGLPGPLSEGNAQADKLTQLQQAFLVTPAQRAQDFHAQFHVNSKTLQTRFRILHQLAREIVKSCGSCITFHHPPSWGVNPKGLLPLRIWQMDVTHVTEFGALKYAHVSIDTCSGVIFASAMAREKAHHVISHCLEAWAAWGIPQQVKTDNGPACTSQTSQQFCAQVNTHLRHGLPYNPQGQGIVERAHRTLKELLQKQKGGRGMGHKPKQRLSLALLTLNFLQLDNENNSAADRHLGTVPHKRGYVRWKDVITGQWNGPDSVLTWARGCVCVFPQNSTDPVWVPERLTHTAKTPKERTPSEDGISDAASGRSAGSELPRGTS